MRRAPGRNVRHVSVVVSQAKLFRHPQNHPSNATIPHTTQARRNGQAASEPRPHSSAVPRSAGLQTVQPRGRNSGVQARPVARRTRRHCGMRTAVCQPSRTHVLHKEQAAAETSRASLHRATQVECDVGGGSTNQEHGSETTVLALRRHIITAARVRTRNMETTIRIYV